MLSRRSLTRVCTSSAALLLLVPLAACGDDTAEEPAAATPQATDGGHGDHAEHTADPAMNDPHATPADEIDGADLRTGDFALLDTAPPGSDSVAGSVWVAENADGTTVTVRLTGLDTETGYMLHLHEQECSQDNGGDHFAFEKGGSDQPPNEIHLAFTTDADGAGEATVTNKRRIGEDAKSIVLHPHDAMDNRVACADY